MEITTSDFLESRIYRILFEYIKDKKEGVHEIISLMEDIYALPKHELLVYQKIAKGRNALDDLAERNKDVITYLRGYDGEQYKSSLITKLIMNDNVLGVLKEIRDNEDLIDLYLKNAKSLEDLKIEKIVFGEISMLMKEFNHYYCEVRKRNDYELRHVRKCYTDGKIKPVLTLEEATYFYWCHQGYNFIPFDIINGHDCSYVLVSENEENGRQKRKIEISNFGFDGSKLPTEEEISSYKLPKELILK